MYPGLLLQVLAILAGGSTVHLIVFLLRRRAELREMDDSRLLDLQMRLKTMHHEVLRLEHVTREPRRPVSPVVKCSHWPRTRIDLVNGEEVGYLCLKCGHAEINQDWIRGESPA